MKKIKKVRVKSASENEMREALKEISEIASGLRPDAIDYENCFIHAKSIAIKTLSLKCVECGK